MVGLSLNQSTDYVSKSGQRQVDFGCFLESVSCSLGLALPFRTSQVNKIELSSLELAVVFALDLLGGFDINGEDGVTSG